MLKRNTSSGLLPRLTGSRRWTAFLLFASTCGFAKTSQAQAIPVAERTGRIDIYGGYSLTKPDFTETNANGFFIGGTYLLKKHTFGKPGISVRYNRTTNNSVTESFVGAGLDLRYRVKRVEPFVTGLFGVGNLALKITPPYSDSGFEALIGGGADVPITRRFAVRGELNYGFLKITGKNNTPIGEVTLTPFTVNVGAVYHFR